MYRMIRELFFRAGTAIPPILHHVMLLIANGDGISIYEKKIEEKPPTKYTDE